MSQQYAARLPIDASGAPMQEYPSAKKALARYGAAAVTSSVVTLTDNTTSLEVGAISGGGVVMRWVTTADTQASIIATGANANYDHFIPADQVRRFVVPIEGPGVSSIVGANKQNGLYNRVAWIAAAAPPSSVLASEF
jgi:hypothetical protein